MLAGRGTKVADRHADVAEVVGQFVAFCAGMTVLLGFEPCKGAGGIRDVALLDAKTTAAVDVHLGLLDGTVGMWTLIDAQHIPVRIARIPRGMLERSCRLVEALDHC